MFYKKLISLAALFACATLPAQSHAGFGHFFASENIVKVSIGCLIAGMGLSYYLSKKITDAEREKIANKIMFDLS